MVKIIDIEPESIASELGILPGSILIEVNGKSVTDKLDYRFYSADEHVEMLIRDEGGETLYEIEKDPDEDVGLILEEMTMRSCGNRCVFCFVHQNPKGLRRALYFKDEDFRFSFMYGHYVTMTKMTQADLDRIVEQRLSPLYISVHATEEKTRKYLLGIKQNDGLLEKIDFLTRHGITLHTQIVLCPGINDGAVFDRTVNDLKQFYPGVKSVAIVPVGLTRHRTNLPGLRVHTEDELRQMIACTNTLRNKLREEMGIHFVYLSDEFFIKAFTPMPDAVYYDEFYQIENGVGEFRAMIDDFNEIYDDLRTEGFREPVHITWVTGELAARPLEEFIISPLRSIPNVEIDLVPVRNHFYGNSVQVSGLLVGEDIHDQLRGRKLGDIVLLPPRVLNDDGLMLDDWSVSGLEKKLGVPVYVYTEPLSELTQVIPGVLHHYKTAALEQGME